MKIFIPLSDEMLEKGMIPDGLVAYQPGLPVLGQLETNHAPAQSSLMMSESPGPTPNSDALPAFSSSTYMAGRTLG